jgi:putative membrane protein
LGVDGIGAGVDLGVQQQPHGLDRGSVLSPRPRSGQYPVVQRGQPPRWWPQEGDEPDPRWSLANERTLLASLRTSLAFLVAGLAIAGSYSATDAPAWLAMLGLPLILIATVLAATSHGRFLATQRAIRTGEALPPPSLVRYLPWAVVGIGIASLVVGAIQLLVED